MDESARASRARYVRTVVFGTTDSLVSTVGLLAGIDVAGVSHATIALTGVIYAAVEAFSMAVGNFLSEESSDEYAARHDVRLGPSIIAGATMFVVYISAALVPLGPYLLGLTNPLPISISGSVAALFVVGAISARLAHVSMFSRGVRMAVLGAAAIVLGILIGNFLPPV